MLRADKSRFIQEERREPEKALSGYNQRKVQKILGSNRGPLGQWGVPAHKHSPGFSDWKFKHFIFCNIYRLEEKPKINKTLIQIFQNVLSIAAGNMEMNVRVLILNGLSYLCEEPYPVCFSGANINIPCDVLFRQHDFMFCPLNQG